MKEEQLQCIDECSMNDGYDDYPDDDWRDDPDYGYEPSFDYIRRWYYYG